VRVLICDDNEDARQTMSLLVGMERHETRVCPDGASCVSLAREWRPHVGLIDIGMPGMDGYEVARQLRAELGNEILLVAVTGFAAADDVEAAKRAGFDMHFPKANDPGTLLDLVRAGASRPPTRPRKH
jgi:CheY-like chemotaxis protein